MMGSSTDLKSSSSGLTTAYAASTTSSSSPPRTSKVALLGAAIKRALSHDGRTYQATQTDSADDAQARQDRSRSRGREMKSSGRGGAGNIRSAALVDEGTYVDSVPVYGREPSAAADTPARTIISTGRGGAGNFRSPSRDAVPTASTQQQRAHDDEVIRAHAFDPAAAVHSSGRGGAGNIVGRAQSGSRSRSRGPAVHMTGRGGAGNVVLGEHPYSDQKALEDVEEEERAFRARGREGAIHSTGRGGLANLTALPTPPTDDGAVHHTPGAYESTGRGGAGNILSALGLGRSRSRDVAAAGSREASATRAGNDATPRTVAAAQIDGVTPPAAALSRGRERVPAYGAPAASDGTGADGPDAVGARALDARSATRSRSREAAAQAKGQQPHGFWERMRHPLSPRSSSYGRAAAEETIVE